MTDFNKAIEIDSGFAEAYCHRGWMYLQLRKWQEAEYDFRKVIELAPMDSSGYKYLGMRFAQEGDYAAARDPWYKAYEINPQSDDIVFKIAILNDDLGNIIEAKKFVRLLLEINPQTPHRQWAENYLQYK
jgi:tetratricopeptide (TPR) repeat protein